MLFKMTTFSTNGKPVCNLLCVNNSNLHPILYGTISKIADYWSNFTVTKGRVPLFNTFVHCEPVNS